ncbi:MAG: HAD hydrolase-like protein [Provencibacterium sp.]|nr:HAD hydrolase-like protein [Provencibacterium sp.]
MGGDSVNELELFTKKQDFLVCVDSDGCAMDTMDCKHIHCFGPCAISEWELQEQQKEILDYWNQVNLYTMTRGINRFLALEKVLEWVDATYMPIEGLSTFSAWVKGAKELSNAAVKAQYEKTGEPFFKKALCWSQAVNKAIGELPEELKKPFEGVRQGLEAVHAQADVAIVSSANREAVLEEWERFALMDSVDICLTQSDGSKAHCIGEMLKKGYAPEHVLMVGDAPGDQKAAEKNGVFYYPILVKRETESWENLVSEALPRFLAGSYGGAYQAQVIERFLKNLS